MGMEHWWNNNLQEKTEVLREKAFPSGTWYTINQSHMDYPGIEAGS
jgi:hypothetical protein